MKHLKLKSQHHASAGKRYAIFKKDIHHYRILDLFTGDLVVGYFRCLTIKNPSFMVDPIGYRKAKENHFVNDGDPKSFFAWIEADEVSEGVLFQAPHRIKFNPFNGNVFYRVDNNTAVYKAELCTILGNNLYIV